MRGVRSVRDVLPDHLVETQVFAAACVEDLGAQDRRASLAAHVRHERQDARDVDVRVEGLAQRLGEMCVERDEFRGEGADAFPVVVRGGTRWPLASRRSHERKARKQPADHGAAEAEPRRAERRREGAGSRPRGRS